jgi:hypothetical protein
MSKAKENQMKKSDFEISFQDSPEYFLVENAKMIQEGNLFRFICFDESYNYKEDVWLPMVNVHRVKRYPA